MVTSSQSILTAEKLPLSPIEKVRQIAKYILGGIEHFEESAYYFLIVVHASVMEGPGSDQNKMLENSSITIQSMVRILTAGQELGEIREGDPLDMAMVFFSAIQGLAIYKLAVEDFKMPDYEILVDMLKKK